MSYIQRTPMEAVVAEDSPRALPAIRQSGCAAAIWKRKPLPWFQNWIDDLEPTFLPRSRVTLRADAVCDALTNVIDACGMPEGPGRDLLINDASALAAIFSDIMDVEYLRLRLDVIDGNACRKFHLDAVTARMICTYRGTGTQFGLSPDGTEPHEIHTVPTGSPIILRGTLWPEAPLSGLLHRSPPIDGTGETRLLLVLDPVEELNEEFDRHFLH